jgi:arginyl-tRNA--protein-N-Asp/Glu arginylyltransferase
MANEIVVHDALDACSYLPERVARVPLRYPAGGFIAPQDFDERLAQGDRRSGLFLYRMACPQCRACEPIRVEVSEFRPNQTQRRVLRKGAALIDASIGEPGVSAERVALYNAHRFGRGLAKSDRLSDAADYASFLVESCCQTFEIQYRLQSDAAAPLVGVAVCDLGVTSLSAVYCYFDPAHERLSPGVFSVLTQVELCRAWGLRYLYLGLYIAESPHMNYKARFLPHERLIGGEWRRFER